TVLDPCIFCLEEQHRPRWLPCAHSFCAECLEHYLLVRGDRRCPLCRREFQVSAGQPAEASNDSHTDPDPHHRVVPAAAAAASPQAEQFVHLFDIDFDFDRLDMDNNDTLVLTLTEQEIRFFANLYGEVLHEDHSQTS
ncbi:hypothetical protein KR044_009748, partial [Drosophila immigrans]